MIFVPLSLFACLFLLVVLAWFARTQDLTRPAHQLFLGVIALYAVQSLLLTLRWGYELEVAALVVAVVAPILPVAAYLSYMALTAPLKGARLWPLGTIVLNWVVLFAVPDIADALILATYLGFGGLLIGLAWKGPDQLALSPLENTREIVVAMAITGFTLVASGLTDIYIIVDFIRNDGQHVGLIVSVVQSSFVMLIGLCAAFGRVSTVMEKEEGPRPATEDHVTDEDTEIIAQLEGLFEKEGLHRNEELSLRRLSRRLSLPDRRVSNAINRHRGLSVSQFVNEYRIRDACTLLATTTDTILAISLAAGFATKSNFNREFARVTGTSPSEWRKRKALAETG